MRKGQAFLIVVIIIALVVSVFTISVSNSLRSQSLEGTEIYQREQALYVAEYGINQMIYNINNGTTYSNGQSITGNTAANVGSYTATYITPDSSGFGGSAVIKGEGTVGQFKRVIYVSLSSAGDPNVYKYCMFTGSGGNGGLSTSSFTNSTYGSGYFYNMTASTIPDVNLTSFANDPHYTTRNYTGNYTYTPVNNGMVYLHYTGTGNATLTINFNSSVSCSIITDFPNVTVNFSTATWSAITIGSVQYPLIVHKSPYGTSSSFTIQPSSLLDWSFTLNGILYTNAKFGVSYAWLFGDSYSINGMLIAGDIADLSPSGLFGSFSISYTYNYYSNVPPYFSYAAVTKFLIPSFREEY